MKKRMLLFSIASLITAAALVPAANAAVYVRTAPPRPVVERVVKSPGPRYVWVAGYHQWNGRGYAWVPGRWVYPPRPRATWVAPRWHYVSAAHSYQFVAGFWR